MGTAGKTGGNEIKKNENELRRKQKRTNAIGLRGRQLHGDAETTQLHWSGILLASQEGALRLQVTMNNVVLMAVTQRLEDLSHVVTVKERKCSFLTLDQRARFNQPHHES